MPCIARERAQIAPRSSANLAIIQRNFLPPPPKKKLKNDTLLRFLDQIDACLEHINVGWRILGKKKKLASIKIFSWIFIFLFSLITLKRVIVSFIKSWTDLSSCAAVELRSPVNLFTHALQCALREYLRGPQSIRIKLIFVIVCILKLVNIKITTKIKCEKFYENKKKILLTSSFSIWACSSKCFAMFASKMFKGLLVLAVENIFRYFYFKGDKGGEGDRKYRNVE